MKQSRLVAGALLLLSASLPALAAVTASLDRNQIEDGDSVQLTLQHDGRTRSEPNLDPLKQDFDILGTSSGTSMQLVNGSFSTQVQIVVTLSPKHDGNITIPALQWDSETSQPLQLTVGGGGSNNAAANNLPHVFLETSLDQPRPYVQGAATLTVRIYTDQQLYQGGLELNGNSDIAVQVLGKDQQTSEVRDGHHYQVIERKYLLQPQRSGNFTLDGPQLDAQVAVANGNSPFGSDPFFANSPFSGMMRSSRPLHLHGKPISLEVRPRPPSQVNGIWLPASEVTLAETWKPDNLRVHVGEPLTRHLQIRAKGATGAELPDLSTLMNLPEGLKAYPDQPKLDSAAQGDTVVGTRDQDIALIAQKPGHYELPAIHLSWWDTKQDAPHEAVLPARSIDILPAEGGSSAITTAAPLPSASTVTPAPVASAAPQAAAPAALPTLPSAAPASRGPWPWVSLGLGLLWLATLLAWWWQARRSRKGRPIAAPAAQMAIPDLKAVQAACRANGAADARRALLDWARQRWPDRPPLGLKDLASRFGDASLSKPLQELDRACYCSGDWNGEALARALDDGKLRQTRKGEKRSDGSELAPLYP